jgi:hypothetical protein
MASALDLRRIALSLEGTTEAPHFDRTAFKVRRNLRDACGRRSDRKSDADAGRAGAQMRGRAGGLYARIPNAWGARGATTAKLSALSVGELRAALTAAWRHAIAKRA